jgi:S1-C subfamily serine protease
MPRRSFAGKGKTVFFREMMEETTKKSANRLRWVVWSFMGLLLLVAGGVYWYITLQEKQTNDAIAEQRKAMLAQQAQSDSVRRAAQGEYDRLRQELDSARTSAASPAVVDSLRQAFAAASKRTEALEGALRRAQTQVAQQLAAGDSARKVAQAELARVRSELSRASGSQASSAVLDSLRNAFKEAQQRAAAVEAQMRAVKGVNLAAIAEASGPAIGMVWSYNPDEEGSGFMLTQSGYFITNRHVVMDANGKRADSATIIMADQRVETARKADIVTVAPLNGPDLAILRLRGYRGPFTHRIDWSQAHARQGDPAAVIGFPSGSKYAFKESLIPRTTMTSGILSKVTPELIQWEGVSLPGSSGSPVFNGDGDVVAVHRASSEGLKFAVPSPLLIPMLPADAKAELGLQ